MTIQERTRPYVGERLRVLDLFSGIGGFSLGLERAGMRTVAFCEIDPYCRAVLRKHWPNVPIYEDVREITGERLCADGIAPDIITAGFPCQDASVANTARQGIDGARTGLWSEVWRVAADFPQAYILLENVPGLLSAGFGRVLGDLASLGRDAEWRCISAALCGLPHLRSRLFVVAYPECTGRKGPVSDNGILGAARASLAKSRHEIAGTWGAVAGDFVSLRGSHGLSLAMERRRLHAAGNAVIPQIPEAIGRAILAADGPSQPLAV